MKLLESSLLKALSVIFVEIAQISAQDPSSVARDFIVELDDEELCQRLKEQNSQTLSNLSISPSSDETLNHFKSFAELNFLIPDLNGSSNKNIDNIFPMEIINIKKNEANNDKIEHISCRPLIFSISKDKNDNTKQRPSFYFSLPTYYGFQTNSKINSFDEESIKKDEKIVGIIDMYDMMNNKNFSIDTLKYLFFLIISQAVITIFVGAGTQLGKNIIGDIWKKTSKTTKLETPEKTVSVDIPTLINHIQFLIDRYLKKPEKGDKYYHNSNFIFIISCLKTLSLSNNNNKFSNEDVTNLYNKVIELIESDVGLKNEFSNENLSFNNTEHLFTFYNNALFNNYHDNIKSSLYC